MVALVVAADAAAAVKLQQQIDFANQWKGQWTSAFQRVTEAQRSLTQARRGDIIEAQRLNQARMALLRIEQEIEGATRSLTDRERHLSLQLRGMDIEETQSELQKAAGREALELELQLVRMQADQIREQRSGDVEQATRNVANHQRALDQEIARRAAVVESRKIELTAVEATIAIARLGDEKGLTALQSRLKLREQEEAVVERIGLRELEIVEEIARLRGVEVEDIQAHVAAAIRTGGTGKTGGFVGESLADEAARLRRALESVGETAGGDINALRQRVLAVPGLIARQAGGPATGGVAHLVGERGPEIFVPNQSGRIISNAATPAGRGVSAPTVVVNVAGSVITEGQLVRRIRDGLRREMLANVDVLDLNLS